MNKHLQCILGSLLVAALPAAASAKVVLYEDFSGGTLDARWTLFQQPDATAEVVDFEGNKVLKMTNGGAVVAGDPAWTDYTVEGDVYVYDGSYSAYAAGLLFRGTGDYTSSAAANAYVYQGRPGEMQLEKWTVGEWWQHLTEDYAHPFQAGVWQHLKVECRGATFRFWVDGQLVQEYVDPAAHLSGQVGFRTWGVGAYFDNMLVTVDEQPGVLLSEGFEYGSSSLHPLWNKTGQSGLASGVVEFQGRHVLDLNGTGAILAGDPAWTDYTAEADIFVHDTWYSAYAAGLIVRSPSLGADWGAMDAYVWQGRSPYYYGAGLVQLERWSSTQPWTWLFAQTGTPWTDGAWHRLKVIAAGSNLRLFLDDAELGVVDDASSPRGGVGFRAYIVGSYFDDLLVRVNDTAAPVTTATVGGASTTWTVSPATVSLRAADEPAASASAGVREIRFAVDGAGETVVPGAAADVALTDGIHTVTFHAVDRDGNAEAARTLSLSVDATPPAIAIAASPASILANGKAQAVRVNGSVTDALSGVASYSIKVSDKAGKTVATLKAFGQTVNLVGSRGQSYTVTVSANDKAGNKATVSAVIPVI